MRFAARRGSIVALPLAVALALGGGAAAQQPSPKKPRASASSSTKTRTPKARAAKPPVRMQAAPVDVANPREAQAEQTAERDRLTARIAELKARIAAGERSRSGAAVALRRAERALVDVNRRLDELARRQRESQERIAGLDRQKSGAEGRIAAEQAAWARTATMFDADARRDPLQAWLAGGDPGEAALDAVYLRHAARAQVDAIDALHGRVRDLQAERQRADDDVRALLAQADAQRSARETLAADQAAQKRTLDDLAQQIAAQRSSAAALEADEKRLSRVVEQLQRVIDRQAAEERARRQAAADRARRQAEPAARKGRDTPSPARPEPPPTIVEALPEDAGRGAFAQLRGQLRLPVRGTIVGRFGAPRGGSGATWKGVFVRTEPDADVHAVAAGKVVFADDLRGFGNLVIVDHGDQYLSIYGNNATLAKRTGDVVRAGDVVAQAGNSSGDDRTGLYFELRHQGRPFDPLSWTR